MNWMRDKLKPFDIVDRNPSVSSWGTNRKYGANRDIEIFTARSIKDVLRRNEYNTYIKQMMDEIGKLYGGINNIFMVQYFVHDKACHRCQESLPYWEGITHGLQRRMINYKSDKIEIGEFKKIGDQDISGYDLWEHFQAPGVPFIIQNFIIEKKYIQSQTRSILKKSPNWFISYKGKIHPFSFLAEIFLVKNLYIESKKPSTTSLNDEF